MSDCILPFLQGEAQKLEGISCLTATIQAHCALHAMTHKVTVPPSNGDIAVIMGDSPES